VGKKVRNRELKEVDNFKYFGSVLRDDYSIREIKMRIVIVKKAVKRKISLFTSKLNISIRKKLVRCYLWSISLNGSDTWTLRKLESKY